MRRNPKLAGFFVILFAGLFLTLAGRDLYHDWKFDRTPLRSTAIIERTWVTYGNKGATHYHAAYHYVIDGVGYHATEVPIVSWTYNQLRTGEQVPIRYLPEDFTQTRIDWDGERNSHDWNDEKGIGIGLFLAVVGVLILVFAKSP